MKTLKVSLLASVLGIVAWILGLGHKIGPSHPQWAVFFLTLTMTIVLRYAWPEADRSLNS
jgi:hypothetical protein